MSDIVQKSTEYRIKQIELQEAQYYKSLVNVLGTIEDEVVTAARNQVEISDGTLVRLQSAIAIRPQIKAIIDQNYLPWADQVVREGFNKSAKRVEKSFKTLVATLPGGRIPPEFAELTEGDLQLIKNLKQQYFTQFKDVSNNFTRRLTDIVYQNTLIGSDFTSLEKELRQTINGIYSSSQDPEITRLVDFINDNKFIKSKKSEVDKAIQTLQSKFGADRTGENLKRFAGQILNDSLRDFDATLNFNKSRDAGLTFVKYYGDIIPTTREVCRNIINGVIKSSRSDGLFTIDEVNNIWATRSWSGKKPGNPLVVRGGYNCRHQWSYVNPDWYDSNGELITK